MGKLVALLCLTLSLHTKIAAGNENLPLTVKYPNNIEQQKRYFWDEYFIELLNLALQKSGRPFELIPVDIPDLQQARSVKLIREGFYDVHWITTNSVREQQLMPVRFPLYRGLVGWRVAFIRNESSTLFSHINTPTELQKRLAGQGRDWPDLQVLKHNRYSVTAGPNSLTLMQMLELGRIDYFPRSALEIVQEQERLQNEKITIDDSLLIQYPLAVFFFVREGENVLHDALHTGLMKAFEDGSFEQLFQSYFGDYLQQLKIDKRQVFMLENPFMSEQSLSIDGRLWMTHSTNR